MSTIYFCIALSSKNIKQREKLCFNFFSTILSPAVVMRRNRNGYFFKTSWFEPTKDSYIQLKPTWTWWIPILAWTFSRVIIMTITTLLVSAVRIIPWRCGRRWDWIMSRISAIIVITRCVSYETERKSLMT